MVGRVVTLCAPGLTAQRVTTRTRALAVDVAVPLTCRKLTVTPGQPDTPTHLRIGRLTRCANRPSEQRVRGCGFHHMELIRGLYRSRTRCRAVSCGFCATRDRRRSCVECGPVPCQNSHMGSVDWPAACISPDMDAP